MKQKSWICTVATIVLLCSICVPVHATGKLVSASGIVLDSHQKPLPHAVVYAVPQEDMTKQVRTTSDSKGHFSLRGLPSGIAYVDAYEESAGYPYNFFSFFNVPGSNTPAQVEITAGKVASGIVLRLGPRAAEIRFAITNREGLPLSGTLSFDRPDIPGPYKRSVNSGDTIMVPPVPFRFTFEADGYVPWHYGGSKWLGPSGLIRPKCGEEILITIHPQHALKDQSLPDSAVRP